MFVNGKFHLITKVKIVKKCIVNGLCIVNLYWLPPANEVWGKGICSQVSFLLSGEGSLHPRRGGVCIQGGLHPGGLHPGELGRPPPPPPDIKDTVNEWRYASYWNAFLFKMCMHCKPMVQSAHYLGKMAAPLSKNGACELNVNKWALS